MTPIVYRRLSSMFPPEREILDLATDGSFRLWRSIAPVVGRFGGRLPAGVAQALEPLVMAAMASPVPPHVEAQADAGVEQLDLEGVAVRFTSGDDPAGPWGVLLEACRRLTDELTNRSLAAIALELDLDAGRVRLVHQGSEILPLQFGSGHVSVEAWRGTRNLANARIAFLGLERVEAGPGWATEVGLPTLAVEPGDLVTVEATFVVSDAGVYVPVALQATVVAT